MSMSAVCTTRCTGSRLPLDTNSDSASSIVFTFRDSASSHTGFPSYVDSDTSSVRQPSLCACPCEKRRATYVIFDGLRFTLDGSTSGTTDDDAPSLDAVPVGDAGAGVAGATDSAGFALCEHAASTPAQINEEP